MEHSFKLNHSAELQHEALGIAEERAEELYNSMVGYIQNLMSEATPDEENTVRVGPQLSEIFAFILSKCDDTMECMFMVYMMNSIREHMANQVMQATLMAKMMAHLGSDFDIDPLVAGMKEAPESETVTARYAVDEEDIYNNSQA